MTLEKSKLALAKDQLELMVPGKGCPRGPDRGLFCRVPTEKESRS